MSRPVAKLTPENLRALVATSHGVAMDSRRVQAGDVFFAIKGEKLDGTLFITDAVARGARAVVVEDGTDISRVPDGVMVYTSANSRRDVALAAAAFYPIMPASIMAVTGTNGKTSTVDMVRQLLNAMGKQAASLGTLGVRSEVLNIEGALTTPDALHLHQILAQLAGAGVTHAALEASSHGLHQHRLDGVPIKVAAFTNLTRDHLDYHKTIEAYFAAKMLLFDHLLPADGTAVGWIGSLWHEPWERLCRARGQTVISYGVGATQGLELVAQDLTTKGQRLTLRYQGRSYSVEMPLAGTFQALNLLAALSILIGLGIDVEKSVSIVPQLQPIAGRLEAITVPTHPFQVYVDYAHTPDALEQVLNALRPHTKGKLIVVFGCGGDRDKGKRPQMGALAATLADDAIVTDDNPRSEDPATIRAEILAACPKARDIGDRRQAIQEAIALAKAGDTILVAGKGHEQGQIIGDVVQPFRDATVIREALV